LRTMGESSGQLYPFGNYIHTFSALLEQLEAEDDPVERFFRVAFMAQEFATDPIDMYLDLRRSDGHDAPLVELEAPFGPDEENFGEDHLRFAERLVYNIFSRLDVDQRKYGARVVVFGSNPTEIKQAALSLLIRSGFAAALPELARVACLSRASASVLMSIS